MSTGRTRNGSLFLPNPHWQLLPIPSKLCVQVYEKQTHQWIPSDTQQLHQRGLPQEVGCLTVHGLCGCGQVNGIRGVWKTQFSAFLTWHLLFRGWIRGDVTHFWCYRHFCTWPPGKKPDKSVKPCMPILAEWGTWDIWRERVRVSLSHDNNENGKANSILCVVMCQLQMWESIKLKKSIGHSETSLINSLMFVFI